MPSDRLRWLGRALRPVTAALHCVSRRGWTMLGIAVGCWIIYAATAWVELAYAVVALLVLFAGCVLLTLGRIALKVEFALQPKRLVVGEVAMAELRVTNVGERSILSAIVELPVGSGAHRFFVPPLASGAVHDDQVLIPTSRRRVIPVGPAISQRGDPFGLVRRNLSWTDRTDLFVHPVTTVVGTVGAGLLRDLEGRATQDVSTSDLAFHTLRDYQPGDDSRHIHWPSSEKLAGRRGLDGQDRVDEEEFLVRQFLDTRRAHLAVVVDCHPDSYADADEFEFAISAAASVARQAVRDNMQITVIGGGTVSIRPAPVAALDGFARLVAEDFPLEATTHRLLRLAPGISSAVVVTGGQIGDATLLAAAARVSQRVGTMAIRCATGSAPSISRDRRLTLLRVGGLADLAATLQVGASR